MSTFLKPGGAYFLGASTPEKFRLRLTLVLGLLVTVGTLLVLFFTQRAQENAATQGLHDKFEARLGFVLGAQKAREVFVTEQCRMLARSVRLQAALEARDWENLYAVLRIELRGVLAEDNAGGETTGLAPKAGFFRLLSADHKLLPDPMSSGPEHSPELELDESRLGSKQEVGFLELDAHGGKFWQVVATPIWSGESELLATLILGFPAGQAEVESDPEVKSGLWFGGRLHSTSLSEPDRAELEQLFKRAMLRPEDREKYITAELNGTRCIVFHKILNEGSVLPQARLVCVYSLAAAEARQSQVRRGILVAAFLVLMTGLGASHAFSTTLSRPVEALEMEKKDQSARREAAEAARDMNELKYRGIFENAVEGIFVITPEGCGLSFNPSMARLLGFDTAGQLLDATQSGCDSFFEPPAVAKSLLQRVQTEGVVSNAEAQMRTHDGRHLWVSLNARGVRDSSGNLLHVEGTLEDITERRQAAETLQRVNRDLEKAVAELKATQNQLVQQERLSALGQMASGIAHDFNNSLMPITGYTELLLSNPEMLKDQKKTQTYLEIIRTAAKDGASIVSRLREFYRSSHPSDDFAPVDLPPLLREAILLTQPKWKRQALAGGAEIRVIEELAPVPVIQGNESSLRETFTNLIFNAVDAMPSGGTLTFRTRIEDDNVVVELADTGTGMSEEVRRRCLEPFFTTKGERGTGLGLSMVFGIMQRHGGTLDLKSRLGQGTAFLLRFPKRVSEPERPEVEAELPLKPGALRVLLAEDERQVREVLTAFLELDGHRVRAVSNGSEALAKFGEETFDVVITDKAMPGMNGAQLANEIKQRAPRVPVILLSGFNSPGHDEHVPDVDIVAAKPITMTTLRTVLRQAAELASGPA